MRTRLHHRHPPGALTLAAVAALALAGAADARAEPARALRIPGGPLHAALASLAAQTGQQLLYTPDLTQGRATGGLDGRFTAEQALARLLAAEDIQVSRAGPNVLVLQRRRAAGAASAPAGTTEVDAAPPRPFGDDGTGVPDVAASRQPGGAALAATPTATVDELRVTGSHIRGAGQGASPVLVLDRQDLDRSGHATVAGLLNALPQNFAAGGATEGSITTGADALGRNATYATGVNLRGLGADATLVLVNGRRLAGSGAFGDFSDVSSIPTGAVGRIEVLLDGASAIYGSDAVGGVVNVILRRDLSGAETRLLAGGATAGEPRQTQLSQTFGRRWAGGGVLLAYEHQTRGALPGAARRFSADADLRPLGGRDHRLTTSHPGNILRTDPATGLTVPGWAIPAGQDGLGLRPADLRAGAVNLQNPRLGVDVLPEQTLHSLYLAADQALGERLEVSGDARYGHRRFDVRLTAPASNFTVTRANPYFVSPTGAASHTLAYSFVDDLPNPRQTGSAETLGLSLAAALRLAGDWRADAYLAFAQEINETHTRGLVNASLLSEALGSVADRPETAFNAARDGYFNPFTGRPGGAPPAVLAHIGSGFTSSRSKAQVSSANLQADGSLWRLPAGPVQLALGGQVRRETLVRVGSNFTSTVAPTPQQATDVGRQVTAGFAELRAPLFGPQNRRRGLERLELSLAGRVERYDDVGVTANPKLGIVWEPLEGLRVRGAYGRAFRAPALREVHDPALNTPALFPLGAGRIRGLLLSGGNPDLEPETARTWTLGADLTPARVPGLRLGITTFDVRFEDRIDRPVQQNALNALSDPTLASFVTRISPTTNAADLARITALLADPATSTAQGSFPPQDYGVLVDNRYVNTAGLEVRGLDLSAAYGRDLGDHRLELAANGSWLLDYVQQVTPTSAAVDKVGIAGYPVKLRARLTADWSRRRLGAGLALNYVSAYRDSLGARIGAQPTVDLQLRLAPADAGAWQGVGLALTVRNLLDRGPPFYDNVAGVGYDPTNADPIGRFVALQLSRAW